MSWFLYRLGRFSFRHRWIVLVAWIVAIVAVGAGAAAKQGTLSNSFTIDGLESTDAFALIEERTPGASADGASARVVFQAPKGDQLADHRDAVDDVLDELRDEHVVSMASPFDAKAISKDGRTGYATILYEVQSPELPKRVLEGFADVASDGSATSPLVAVGGDANEEQTEMHATEGIGVLVALLVLAITLGTLRAAGMSILTAILGVAFGAVSIMLASGFFELGATTPMLGTMLGLAVGIDYALFIVSRYRHELRGGRTPEEAAGVAVGTAGSAVIFAGLTVIIALCGLAVAGIPFLTEMGFGAAFTVFVAVLIALTLLPALCGFAGTRVLTSRVGWLRRRGERLDALGANTMGRRWAVVLTRHATPLLIAGLVVAVLLAIPVRSMDLALPDQGTKPKDSQARVAYDLISDNFGPGANGPLIVLVDTKGIDDPEQAYASADEAVDRVKGDSAAIIPGTPNPDTDYSLITVIPKTGPSDPKTADLVEELRDDVRDVARETGADIYVSGQTAVGVDVSASLAESFPRYLLVVVGLAMVLLLLVFRSILVPVTAVLGFLASVLVALGTVVAIAQWGWAAGLVGIDTPGPIMSMLPLLLTGILFGLAMDYEIFLVSRMHEEHAHGADNVTAIVEGFRHSGRVVVAAAIIMISVFGSFAFGVDPIIKQVGLSLAVGVLADAFLVRMLVIPATMKLIGEPIWWIPAWLDRVLPNLDLEGYALTQRLAPDFPPADPVDEREPVEA